MGKGVAVAVSPDYPGREVEAEAPRVDRATRWRSPGSSTNSSGRSRATEEESSDGEGIPTGRHTKVTVEDASPDEGGESDASTQPLSLSSSEIETADMQQIKLGHLVGGKHLPGAEKLGEKRNIMPQQAKSDVGTPETISDESVSTDDSMEALRLKLEEKCQGYGQR